MSRRKRRFQSGREIMETYVPGYIPATKSGVEGRESRGEAAQKLLRLLNKRLGSLQLRPSKAKSGK